MTIKLERAAAKQIESFDKALKQRIKAGIDGLPKGDIKKLQGYTATYRLRIGDYRIIYTLTENTLIIKAILPRGAAYKNL